MMTSQGFSDNSIKQPNVAGQFYTADPQELSSQIQEFLKAVPPVEIQRDVEMLIAPHAGYIYSGQIAAYAFKQVEGKNFQTVIVLAPSHHYGFPGISVWREGGYQTPLGVLNVDEDIARELIASDDLFVYDPAAFEREHALEVELPFIQEAISKDVKIVPVIMGQSDFSTCQKVADSLNKIIGDRDDILVVVSSDMSHFHHDNDARVMDGKTLKLVENLDAKRFWKQCAARDLEMCGFVPVTTAMLLAKMRGLEVDVLVYGNSGDVTGDKRSVVGYTSIVFFKKKSEEKISIPEKDGAATLSVDQKRRLLDIAKQTIDLYVREKKILEVKEEDPRLNDIEGAFVTIHKHGQLRGCIGNIIGQQPLYLTIRDMAIAAASNDPRFNSVAPAELNDIDIEISVLSKPYRAKSPDEIEMGVHGVIVRRGRRQGVFLPQVATETGWDRATFLSQLCSQKAGLSADAWKDPKTELNIFTATVFSENDINE